MAELYRASAFALAQLGAATATVGLIKGYLRAVGVVSARDQAMLALARQEFKAAFLGVNAHPERVGLSTTDMLRIIAKYHRMGKAAGAEAYEQRRDSQQRPSQTFTRADTRNTLPPVLSIAYASLQGLIRRTRHIPGGSAIAMGGYST